MKFVDVILPLPLSAAYTYALPEEQQAAVRPGCRVIVPFGAKSFIRPLWLTFTGGNRKVMP